MLVCHLCISQGEQCDKEEEDADDEEEEKETFIFHMYIRAQWIIFFAHSSLLGI